MSGPLILCYHAVSAEWPAALSITPRRLRAQVELLLRRGYRPVRFSEAVAAPAGRRTLAITFDDAYRSVRTLAGPILAELGAPATVFAPTSFIGSEEPMLWPGIEQWHETPHRSELVPMSWAELTELAELGWEIGSHTHTHPHLTQLSDARIAEELQLSRERCQQALEQPCTSLAYPYGDHDARVMRAAGEAGYLAAATLPVRLDDPEPLRWPRVGVYYGDGPLRFRLKASAALRGLRRSRLLAALYEIRAGRA